MAENFTAKQKEIVARKLGYDGPMQGFDDFLNSSPALAMKYAAITDKFATRMAKGGIVAKAPVRKYQEGGAVTTANQNGVAFDESAYLKNKLSQLQSSGTIPSDYTGGLNDTAYLKQYMAGRGLTPEQHFQQYGKSEGIGTTPSTTTSALATSPTQTTGAPGAPMLTTYGAAQAAVPTGAVAGQTAPTEVGGVSMVAAPTPIAAPKPIVAPTAVAASAAEGVSENLEDVTAQQGVVSEGAKVVAAEQAPGTTAVAGVEAAQGVAGTVQGAPTRTVQEGEMVTGPSVDMARAEEVMARTEAAQGVVTEEMTVQGQLNKLTKNFDAGNPPPWAAASMRAATAQMAARGLGASSLAGQAIIQATLEAATPLAAADAKVFETMGLQNLSNRQQTAMLIGQQRAAFLGQEFDQAFQTKVLNAAKISDIANKNFDAQTTIAIENSRLANSMDIANLSARNAVVLAKMAQMSRASRIPSMISTIAIIWFVCFLFVSSLPDGASSPRLEDLPDLVVFLAAIVASSLS